MCLTIKRKLGDFSGWTVIEKERTQMEKKIKDYIIYEHTSDSISRIKLIEHWVPMEFTDVQLELLQNNHQEL